MNSFWRIFWLECIALVRSKTLALLSIASVVWVVAAPYLLQGDGTAEGAREVYIRYALGGVFGLVAIALLASATGTLARERAAKRLQLTMVRPVRYAVIACGKILAMTLIGAFVLALAFGVLLARLDCSQPCDHVLSPILPSVAEEARDMYASYMADPETPDSVKKADKSVVMRMLRLRAIDHYQTMPTNALTSWTFPACTPRAVRMRFTNQLEMRQDVNGVFRIQNLEGVVTNITQAILEIPLVAATQEASYKTDALTFFNRGKYALMLRPRQDIKLLVTADSFAWNAWRAYLELVSILALLIAFGTFLSSGLSRPVALFTAIVMLVVCEMSPSVVEQYGDELEAKPLDRLGLYLTRTAAELTRPVAVLAPLEKLSKDECVEAREVAHTLVVDFLTVPLVLAFASAFLMPKKQEEI